MKRAHAAAALGAILATASARAGTTPTYAELPLGTPTTPMATAAQPPKTIPARETAAGFHATIEPDAIELGDGSPHPGATDRAPETCFASMWLPQAAYTTEWQLDGRARLTRDPTERPSLVAVHAERVVDVTLESTDALFDPRTKGFRVVGRSTLPLRLLATAPGGVRILAARREGQTRSLEVIIARDKNTPLAPILATQAVRSDGLPLRFGGCAHQRFSLPVDKTNVTASMRLTTVLAPDPTGKVRMRPLRAQVSVSQTSRDPDPIISVSTGWAGAETVQPTAIPLPSSPPGEILF